MTQRSLIDKLALAIGTRDRSAAEKALALMDEETRASDEVEALVSGAGFLNG